MTVQAGTAHLTVEHPHVPPLRVPRWTVLSGMGQMGRTEICQYLALFEDTGLLKLAFDGTADLMARWTRRASAADGAAPEQRSFERRLAETARRMDRSTTPSAALRLQLWDALVRRCGIDPCLPLSIRSAGSHAIAMTDAAARVLDADLKRLPKTCKIAALGGWAGNRVRGLLHPEPVSFDMFVSIEMARLLALIGSAGQLDDETRQEMVRRIRQMLENVPAAERDEATRAALNGGDNALLLLAASGGTLLGLGVAVELAGFGAYVLAAQASALLPFIGGQAAVSGLFVLSNPLVALPLLLGGTWLADRHVTGSALGHLSAKLSLLLAIRGMASGRAGLCICLDDFKNLTPDHLLAAGLGRGEFYATFLGDMRGRAGGRFEPTPGEAPGLLGHTLTRLSAPFILR